MDQQQGDSTIGTAKALLTAVRGYLDEHYPYWQVSPGSLPDGLRLEIHPNVRLLLLADDDNAIFGWARLADMRRAFGVPVKVNVDLPAGHWRLVIVTEDVLAGDTAEVAA